jgi:hypothetical protein
MMSRRVLLLMGALGLPLAFGQNRGIAVAVPRDPLEFGAGEVQVMEGPDQQKAVQLLTRARQQYAIHNGKQGYRLKVTFQVDSGGLTQYDGDWEMEEIYVPALGMRWTAKTAGYATTQIFANGLRFGEGAGPNVPLRLHQVRATLFDPIGIPNNRDIRSVEATYNGVAMTCVLSAGPEHVPTEGPGRRWDETEDCIDPESGLLQIQSVVPGRYYVYDYTDAPKLGPHILPRKVTVLEGGKTVVRVDVDSLTELSEADPKLFTATKEMTWGVNMVAQQKMTVFAQKGSIPQDATVQPVCVFGLITPSGQLVEAHALQSSGPNSAAAVEYAKGMHFAVPNPAGGEAQQHFVYIIEKFVAGSASGR